MFNGSGFYPVTRDDCRKVIEGLTQALIDTSLGSEVDFFVYGSYFGSWRDGISDLDGILFFKQTLPISPSLRKKINYFQSAIAKLQEALPFLKNGHFLADLFVLDWLHATDGRFLVFDREWLEVSKTQSDRKIVHGSDFIESFQPVALRNQNEFELATGLHKLRNYWFFEIPKKKEDINLARAQEALKFFKVLPRTISIILGRPMVKTPAEMVELDEFLTEIDLKPLVKLFEETTEPKKLTGYVKSWHGEPETFSDCLQCFEKVLENLVCRQKSKSLPISR